MPFCSKWARIGMFIGALLVVTVAEFSIRAQSPASTSPPAGNLPVAPTPPVTPGAPANPSNATTLASSGNAPARAASMPASGTPGSDYIPCLLDTAKLSQLRGQQPPKYLTKSGAEDEQQAIAAAIDSLVASKVIESPDVAAGIKTKLTANELIGSDASQSVDKVREATDAIMSQQGSNLSDSQKKIAADAIVGAAIEATNKNFEAPPDVACSMSLLTYQETNDIFGLRVAKDYVAVQVIVRNLNQQDEYLLHDVLLAVDTDPCGSFSQFDGGRDRLLVRAVALRNQFTDPRNVAVRILEGVGTVASTAVGFASRDYSLGLGVFNGLSPAAKAIFPDYTVDQLNRLSDLAFTSSGQTRTVVSKDGVVMFVTFFPEKPLEQAWWINDAGAALDSSDQASAASSPACVREQKALAAHFNNPPTDNKADSQATGGAGNARSARETNPFFRPKAIAYRKWDPNALLEFRRHTFVAVAGVHIAQEDDLKPVLDDLTCPETNGVLNLDPNGADAGKSGQAPAASADPSGSSKPAPTPTATTSSTFVCKAKGKNLDKVTKLRFRDARDSLDIKVADGGMTIAGDSTQGTVTFNLKDLTALTGDTYNVVWMDNKSTLENNTGQVVKLAVASPSPVLAKDNFLLTLATLKDGTLTLAGTNLDKVTGVEMFSAGSSFATLTTSKPGAAMLTVQYTKAVLSKLAPGSYTLVPVVNGKASATTSNCVLTLK
ncbi:MAG TPA: hypothetical protein VGG85_15670 [Terracidiphilus sp.]|jgi:hypothetical protein